MIEPGFKDETLKALCSIILSKETFVVCGSRWFGDASDKSDFDFVTENQELISKLEAAGWSQSKSVKKNYLDSNTVTVLQKAKVQMIFAKSLNRRIKAREYIISHGLDRHKTESWETAYGEPL